MSSPIATATIDHHFRLPQLRIAEVSTTYQGINRPRGPRSACFGPPPVSRAVALRCGRSVRGDKDQGEDMGFD